MTNPSSRALPPPKQIRFVNNQGQPPSKRRRINAAYVPNLLLLLVFLLFSLLGNSVCRCRLSGDYRAVCGVVSVKCGVGQFSVADSEAARWREDCILKLCQMLDLPQEENPMCG